MKSIEQKIAELITFCKNLDQLFFSYLEGKRMPDNLNSLVVTGLFARTTEIYSGVISIAQTDVPLNGYILIRSMCESHILMKKCIVDENFLKKYSNQHFSEKAKRLKRIAGKLGKTKIDLSEEELKQLEEYTRSQIFDDTGKGFQVSQLFSDPEEYDLYEHTYAHCCLYTHCDASTIEEHYMKAEPDGSFLPKIDHPTHKDKMVICMMSASVLFRSFLLYCKFLVCEPEFKQSVADKINEFDSSFRGVFD